jgi:DNA-binding transcriptional MerR regulator
MPYLTGDVESILGITDHVIRYWEHEIPFLSATRTFGRRSWTESEIALLFRVKHLVRNKGLRLAKATERIIQERTGDGATMAALIAEIKADLIKAFFETRQLYEGIGIRAQSSKQDYFFANDGD